MGITLIHENTTHTTVYVTLIYLLKKDYFIADLHNIFGYFLYTTSLRFFVQGNQHTTNRLTQQLSSYHGDTNTNSFIESSRYLLAVNDS